MRWVHMTVVVLFAGLTFIFAVQNFEIVAMDFLGFSLRMPMALLALAIYVLGMVTGGSLLALLRRSIAGANLT